MGEPTMMIALAGFAVAGLGLASAAALRAWTEWLELKRLELERRRARRAGGLNELRERVRRLESIASGVEL